MKPILKIKKMSKHAQLPTFSKPGDACFDLYSPVDVIIPAGMSGIVDLQIASEIPAGYEVVIRPRSGLAFNHNLFLHIGTIDSGYRGNWMVKVFNHSAATYIVHRGDRVAQGALRPVPEIEIEEVDSLEDSERGKNGIGSTGK